MMKKYILILISSFTMAQTVPVKDTHNYTPHQLSQSFFEKIDYSGNKVQNFLKRILHFPTEEAVRKDIDQEYMFTKRFLDFNKEYDPYDTTEAQTQQAKKNWQGVYSKMIENPKGVQALTSACQGRFVIGSIQPKIIQQKKYNYYYQAVVEMQYIGYNSFDENREDPFTGSCYNVVHLVQIDGRYYLDGLVHYFDTKPKL